MNANESKIVFSATINGVDSTESISVVVLALPVLVWFGGRIGGSCSGPRDYGAMITSDWQTPSLCTHKALNAKSNETKSRLAIDECL
jgi:hypothetical protein